MEITSFDSCGTKDGQANFHFFEFDTPTNKNVQDIEDPLKKEIRQKIMSSEVLLDISISFQITRPPENRNIYSMEGYKLRGVVCILNIKEFNKQPERCGSEMDVEYIKNLFEKLEYKIIEIKEVKKEYIKKKIDEIKNDMDLEEASNFIMFLMSHGIEGFLIDVNDKKMPIKETFLEPFSTCKPLFNKPKLFFIQACRGNEKSSYAADGSCEEVKENYIYFDGKDNKNFADFFIFNSTFESYFSIRHKIVGTVFIRCLVLTISSLCHQHSLLTIVHYVKDILKKLKIEKDGEYLNQIASCGCYSLTKDVYFLPPAENHPSYADEEDAIYLKEDEQDNKNLSLSARDLLDNHYFIDKVQLAYHCYVVPTVYFEEIEELKTQLSNLQNDMKTMSILQSYSTKILALEVELQNFESIDKNSFSQDANHRLSVFVELKQVKENLESIFEELDEILAKKISQNTKARISNNLSGKSDSRASKMKEQIAEIDLSESMNRLLKRLNTLKNFLHKFQYGFIDLSSVFIKFEECLDLDNDLLSFWKELKKELENDDSKNALFRLRAEIAKKKERLSTDLKLERLTEGRVSNELYSRLGQSDFHYEAKREKAKNIMEISYAIKKLSNNELMIDRILHGMLKTNNTIINHNSLSEFHNKFSKIKTKLEDNGKYFENKLTFENFIKALSDLIEDLSEYSKSISDRIKNSGIKSYDLEIKKKKKQVEEDLSELKEKVKIKIRNSKSCIFTRKVERLKELLDLLEISNSCIKEFESLFDEPTLLVIDVEKCLQFDDELSSYWHSLKNSSMTRNALQELLFKLESRLRIE